MCSAVGMLPLSLQYGFDLMQVSGMGCGACGWAADEGCPCTCFWETWSLLVARPPLARGPGMLF